MSEITLTERDLPAMESLCWKCNKPRPKDRLGMYDFYCSQKCEDDDMKKYENMSFGEVHKQVQETVKSVTDKKLTDFTGDE